MSGELGQDNCTVVASNAELQEAIAAQIDKIKEGDPLAPVTLLVSSKALAWQLRRQLASRLESGSGFAAVRALTETELLDECALALGLPPASGGDRIVRAAVLENELRRAGGVLGVSADHPETAVRLGRLMDDLRWCELDDESLKGLSEVASPTSTAAIEFIASVRSQVSKTTGSVDLVALSKQILERLASTEGTPAGIAALGSTIVVSQSIPSAVWSVVTGLGLPVHRVRIKASADPVQAAVHGVPDPATEAALAARYVAQAIHSKVDPQQIAIVYSTAIPYASLLHHALNDAQIDWHGPSPSSLRETMLARRIDTLLEMASQIAEGQGLPRPLLMRWLALDPARAASDDPSPAALRSLIRSEGLFADARSWRAALEEIQASVDSELEDEDGGSGSRARRRTAKHAGHLAGLIDELTSYLRNLVDARTWEQIAVALTAAVDRYSPPSATPSSPAEGTARSLLTDALTASLPLVDSMVNARTSEHLRPAPQTLRALIDREFDQMRASYADASIGLHVGPVASTRGLTFDMVIVVGAADGLLPSVRNTNPLLNDATRKHVRADASDAPTVVELEEQTQRDVVAVCAGARSLVALFPRGAIPGSGVSQVSRYFQSTGDQDRTAFLSYGHALDTGPKPITDTDLAVAQQLSEGNPDGELRPLLSALESWARPQFTEQFGNVGSQGPTWSIGSKPLSASAIESYLRCPYRFFVDRVLGFSTDTFNDEIEEISAKDLGLLLHSALEEVVSTARAEGWLPAPGEAWPEDATARATSIFLDKATEAEAKGMTGWEPAWRAVREEVLEAIPEFLRVDAELRSSPPTAPGEPELAFGFDGQPSAEVLTSANTPVALRGAIDRLDVSADGSTARVIDYKSGSASKFTTALKKRERVQDLVYSAAVQALRPQITEVLVSFLFLPNRGDVKAVNAPVDADEASGLTEILDRIEAAAEAGSFPPDYKGSEDYCPVCSVLGRRSMRISNDHRQQDGEAIIEEEK